MRAKVRRGDGTGEATRLVFRIETVEDYGLAKHRIESLKDSTRGDDEEQELQALIDAVERWDADHAAQPGRHRR